MATHIRPTTPPPTRIRVATANAASAAPLTGDLLAASAGASGSVTHRKADFNGQGYGDVAFSAGNATASAQKNAGDFVALYESANRITSAKRTTISQNTASAPGPSEAGDGFGRVIAYGDFAASPHNRWGAALAASDIKCDGYPMFGANAAN